MWFVLEGTLHLFPTPISGVPELYALAATFASAQARLMCLKRTLPGRKAASWFSDVQVASCGALSQECQCQRNRRTGSTSFTMSLHMGDRSDYEIIAYRL